MIDTSRKYQITQILKGCNKFENFNEIIKDFNSEEQTYAQCWWICREYQFVHDADKVNKLKNIFLKYNLDSAKIRKFVEINPREWDTDRHILNIFKLDEKLNTEKQIQDRIEFIGEKAIDIVPIEHPSKCKNDENLPKNCIEGYKYNYEKTHLGISCLNNCELGHYLKIKIENENYKTLNKVILSERVVKNKLFNFVKREQKTIQVKKSAEITKDLQKYILKPINQLILDKLDDNGIIKIGARINKGDILVGCIEPNEDILNSNKPEDKILVAMFGKVACMKESSIRNDEFEGIVSDVKICGKKIDIVIDVNIGLEIGDTLGDLNNNRGMVCEIISLEEMKDKYCSDYDMVTNFYLDDYVLRYYPSVKGSLNCSIGNLYSFVNQQPINENSFLKPLNIDTNIFNKFYKYNLLDCLLEMINYSKMSSYDNSITTQVINKGMCAFIKEDKVRMDYLKFYFLILGYKLDCIGNLVHIKKLNNNELLQMSYGNISKSDGYNYRISVPELDGMFCERVFGPIEDFKCHCGKYNRIRYRGTVCEKCGVEVTSSIERYVRCGHIEIPSGIKSIFGDELKYLIVIPPNIRPYLIKEGKVYTSELNDFYSLIIRRVNLIKRYQSENNISSKSSIDYSIKDLQVHIHKMQKYALSQIVKMLQEFVYSGKIIYYFSGICSIDNLVSKNQVLIPRNVLMILMKPYIINYLAKKQNKNTEKILNNYDEKDNCVLKAFEEIVKDKNILLFSNNGEGSIEYLNAGITEGNAILVNENTYKKLHIKNGFVCGILPMTENCKQLINKNISLPTNNQNLFDNKQKETDIIYDIILSKDNDDGSQILKTYLEQNSKIELKTDLSTAVINALV